MSASTFGVYLRPDAITCRVVADITALVKRQFGLVSAAAFPPHITLIGGVPSEAREDEWIAALERALLSRRSFEVFNIGVMRKAESIEFDVDRTFEGCKNIAIGQLANDLWRAVLPLVGSYGGYELEPFDAERFAAHISLASHDLRGRAHLRDEVEAFIRELALAAPQSFTARTITLFRFESANWEREWWHDLSWRHVRSWSLVDPA